MLGFHAPTDFTKQDPFLYAGKAWTAGIEGTLVRVRSLVFHCPTLIDSSYDQTGKKSGAQLGVVPVTVPSGSVQVWQAAFNNSVPCALHGANISTIEFYVRDQDLSFIDLQSTAFQTQSVLAGRTPDRQQLALLGPMRNRLMASETLHTATSVVENKK